MNFSLVQFLFCESESEVAQLCLALCDPMNYSLPGSSVYGIFQARILKWVAISFSRASSQPRDRTQSPALRADALPSEATREALIPYFRKYALIGEGNGTSLQYSCLENPMDGGAW